MNPFDWPFQVRSALAAWVEKVIPADLFDVEQEEDEAPNVLFGGGKYEPPGDASTLLAAKEAMWADHVEGNENEAEWNFWVRLAVLMSDVARGYEEAIEEDPGAAVYYDQELWVASNYLEMTGRTPPGGGDDE